MTISDDDMVIARAEYAVVPDVDRRAIAAWLTRTAQAIRGESRLGDTIGVDPAARLAAELDRFVAVVRPDDDDTQPVGEVVNVPAQHRRFIADRIEDAANRKRRLLLLDPGRVDQVGVQALEALVLTAEILRID